MPLCRQSFTGIVLVAALLLGAGCATRSRENSGTDVRSAEGDISVSVRNEHGFPVTVNAIGSGVSWKMGRIPPGTSGNFRVPMALVSNGPVEFEAVADFSAPFRSGALMLRPGQVVDFTVKSPLYASTAIVRR